MQIRKKEKSKSAARKEKSIFPAKRYPTGSKKESSEKKKAYSADSTFLNSVHGYYTGPGIFSCTDGYSKTYRMIVSDSISMEDWHDDIRKLLRHKCRFLAWNEEEECFDISVEENTRSLTKIIYVIVTIKAQTVDETIQEFSEIGNDLFCTLEPLNYEDTIEFMSRITGSELGEKKHLSSIAPKIRTEATHLEFENRCVMSFEISGFPDYIFPALIPELLRLASGVHASVNISPIDIDACLAGAKKDTKTPEHQKKKCIEQLESARKRSEKLYSVGAYFCIDVSPKENAPEKIKELMGRVKLFSKKFGLTINDFYGQQKRGFASFFPYGKPILAANKMIRSENIDGLLPWSPLEKIESGCTYGLTTDTKRIIQLDRFRLQANGFILSSDRDEALSAARHEIESVKEHGPVLVIAEAGDPALQTLTDGLGFRNAEISAEKIAYWSTDSRENRELMRMLFLTRLGFSKNKEKILNDCIDCADESDVFAALYDRLRTKKIPEAVELTAFLQENRVFFEKKGNPLSIEQCTAVSVKSGPEKDGGYLSTLVRYSLYMKARAKSVYITGAEKFLKDDPKENDHVLTTYIPGDIKRFYLLPCAKSRIGKSGFVYLMYHAIPDKLQLLEIAELEKQEIRALGAGNNVLITSYNNFIIEGKKHVRS